MLGAGPHPGPPGRDEPGPGKVWAEVRHDSEHTLAAVLRARQPRTATAAPPTCEERFTAAVAVAAVRVAVESWAATTAPNGGPEGPAELALRNLNALRDFAWWDPEPAPVPEPKADHGAGAR